MNAFVSSSQQGAHVIPCTRVSRHLMCPAGAFRVGDRFVLALRAAHVPTISRRMPPGARMRGWTR